MCDIVSSSGALGEIVFVVADCHVGDVAVFVGDRSVDGVDEAFVRCDVEFGVAFEYFLVEGGIDFDTVVLHEIASGLGSRLRS